MKNLALLTSCLIFCSLLIGCNKNSQVTGKITFPDGTPFTTGTVVFENEKTSANGRIQPDGTYRLGSVKENDGVPKGSYRVSISGAVTYGAAPEAPKDPYASRGSASPLPASIPLINRKFFSAETSELKCDVKGNTVYDIQVEKP